MLIMEAPMRDDENASSPPFKQQKKYANMDIKATLGKRVSARQGDFVTAQSNQAAIRKPWKSLAAVAFGLLLSAPGLTQAQYRFYTIDVPGATRTSANGNSTHEIAGDFDDADGNTHGFVLNKITVENLSKSLAGVFTTIDRPGADGGTVVNGINASGQLAGTYVVGTIVHGFFENKGYFTTLDPFGSIRTQVGFINAQGQVVGTYRDPNSRRLGFIWRNGTFAIFHVPGDDPVLGTVAFGINDRGDVVGDYLAPAAPSDVPDAHRHGFLRNRKGDFTTFDFPDSDLTIGEGINNSGTIVGLYIVNGLSHGFVLNNGAFMTVDVPDPSGKGNLLHTEIYSINAKGEIVGTYFDSKPDGTDGMQHGLLGVPAH
jgi:hypothetical protein